MKMYCFKITKIHHINVGKAKNANKASDFSCAFQDTFPEGPQWSNATQKWKLLRDRFLMPVLRHLEKKEGKCNDWFGAHTALLTPIME